MPSVDDRRVIDIASEMLSDSDYTATSAKTGIDEEVQLTLDIRRRYDTNSRRNFVKNALEDDLFRNNVQWATEDEAELEKRNQMPIVVNMIKPAVDQAVAMLTSNSPRFQTTAREDSDNQSAALFSDLMSWIWYISDGDMELKRVIDDMYVRGMGALMIYVDPYADFGKGEVFVKAINPLDIFLPPSSKSPFSSDADSIIVRSVLTLAQLYNMYPQDKATIKGAEIYAGDNDSTPQPDRKASEGQVVDTPETDETTKRREVLDRYTRVKIPHWHILDSQTGHEKILDRAAHELFLATPAVILTPMADEENKQYITKPKEVQYFIGLGQQGGGYFHYMQDPETQQMVPMPGIEHDGAVPNSTIYIQVVTMQDMVEAGIIVDVEILVDRIRQVMSVGTKLLFKGTLPISNYPVITFMNTHNRNPYPMSDVRFVKGIQEYINKIRSLVIAHATNTTNQTLILPLGYGMNKQEVREEFARAGTSVFMAQPDEKGKIPVTVISPPPLPNELYKNMEDAKREINDILGLYPLMQGDSSSAPATFKGTVALDEFGQRRIRSKRDDVEAALNKAAKVCVEYMQSTYTEEKTIRLLQPNNKPKYTELNRPVYHEYSGEVIERINDISVGSKDVIVIGGSTMPSNRWARLDYYMDLFEKGILRDDETVLRETDIRDVDEVIARSSIRAQLEQALGAAQEEVKKYKGDLQTRERELFHKNQQYELEKWENELRKKSDSLELKAKITQARSEDILQRMQATDQTLSSGGSENSGQA